MGILVVIVGGERGDVQGEAEDQRISDEFHSEPQGVM